MHSEVLRENKSKTTNQPMISTIDIDLHISIETFVRIPFEHNQYVHDLSMNLVDNELEQEQVGASVLDRRQRAEIK